MEIDNIEQEIERIVLKITRKQGMKISGETRLDDLGADSLDKVQILMALEETFDIEISDDEIASVTDMNGFKDLLNKKVEAKTV